MKVIIEQDVICGGVVYQPGGAPQDVPENVGQHLIDIGAAAQYETKVVAPTETKRKPAEKKTSSASQPAPASQEPTATRRRGRPRKSS